MSSWAFVASASRQSRRGFFHPLNALRSLPVSGWLRLVMVVSSLTVGGSIGHAEDARSSPELPEAQRRSTAVALNYTRASLHRIRRYPTMRVLWEERDKILNHVNLNGVVDEEVIKLYSTVLDEIAQVHIAEREREVLREQYQRTLMKDLAINTLAITTQAATAQYAAALRTGASSWWDYRTLTHDRENDLWKVEKSRMSSVVEKSTQFLDTSWKMARAKQIPDRWLVRNDDLDRLDDACREPDPSIRLRILKRMEPFMECYPPYFYYLARTQQSLGQLFAASDTFEKLTMLGDGHFRKDEMLAAALANRACIQAFLHQPSAPETAMRALNYSTDVWQANLYCASVLQRYKEFNVAEDAILRNLDVNLERRQSLQGLLVLYCESDNKPRLAQRLGEPESIREIPPPLLFRCVSVLGEDQTPPLVVQHLQNSFQAVPRLNFGKDDVVITASPAWRLQFAQVTLQRGDQKFTQPKITQGKDHWTLVFEGVGELGHPLAPVQDDRQLTVHLAYGQTAPLTLALQSQSAGRDAQHAGRTPATYRLVAAEQEDLRVALTASARTKPDVPNGTSASSGTTPGGHDVTAASVSGSSSKPTAAILPLRFPLPRHPHRSTTEWGQTGSD